MPGVGGIAAVRSLRSRGVAAAMVAVTSADVPGADLDDDAVAYVFDDVIPKPLDWAHVDALVATWVLPCLDDDDDKRRDAPSGTDVFSDATDVSSPR
mmetsp:Transcript_2205/g.5643  ORF Transcript_2205/g.5643 Transcript_2205/m.5643 type:complete len:97 (-) Transcript_2205:433-723(-)